MLYTSVLNMGNRLYFRGREGKQEIRKIIKSSDYGPRAWVVDENGSFTDVRHELKLKEKRFDSIESWRTFCKTYKDVDNFKLFGMERPEYQYIQEQFSRNVTVDYNDIRIFITDIEVNSSNGFPKPEDAFEPVTAVTIWDSHDNRYHTWSTARWNAEDSELKPELVSMVDYVFCRTEQEMLALMLAYWSSNSPDIVSGWNSDGFDHLYIYNRLVRLGNEHNGEGEELANRLSPWGKVDQKTFTNRYGKEQDEVEFFGINHLDYQQLYIKHTFKMRESYKLGHIAFIELGDSKLSYEEAGSLHALYHENPQKFVDYNIKDVNIVVRLNQKMKLFELVIDMAVVSGVNFDDTFSPVKIWDVMVYDYLLGQNVAIPYSKRNDWSDGTYDAPKGKFEGAYVKVPEMGLFGWMLSYDYTSLYPSIMRQWNLGVDTIQNHVNGPLKKIQNTNLVNQYLEDGDDLIGLQYELDHNGLCVAMNGTFYSVERESFMNALMRKLFNERVLAKDKMKKAKKANVNLEEASGEYATNKRIIDSMSTREQALKVLLNSGYGATGNQYFRFYDVRVAEAVTITGQLVTRWIEREFNLFFNKILGTKGLKFIKYIDTDSVYIDVAEFVKRSKLVDEQKIVDFLDDFAKRLSTVLVEPQNKRLQLLTNCREQLMDLKRESIASAAFWKAKKLYALRILDSEGVRKDDLKIMGLESAKSTTAPIARVAFKRCFEIILKDKDQKKLIEATEQFRKEYMAAPIEDIAKGSSVNDLGKYADSRGNPMSGCPQHVRAALIYNKIKSQYDSMKNQADIQNGDKIKIIKLKTPNPLRSEVVGYVDFLPREILDPKYINRVLMFEDGFLSPLRETCSTFGWNVENVNDLSAFF